MKNSKTVTKKDLRRIFWRSLPMEHTWNFERQMHMAFSFMMAPLMEKLYGDDEDSLARALERHLEFYNCTIQLSPFIGGIVASMEELNANEENFDESSINAVKSALIGPLSGIGDSFFLGTLRIIGTGVGTALGLKGNILGPILFLLIYNVPAYLIRYIGVMKGYELGTDYLTKIQQSGLMDRFMLAAGMLGSLVIGGMTNELVNITTSLSIGTGDAAVEIQSILNDILPGLLSIIAFWIFYKLTGKNINPMWLIVGTAILAIFFTYLGILG